MWLRIKEPQISSLFLCFFLSCPILCRADSSGNVSKAESKDQQPSKVESIQAEGHARQAYTDLDKETENEFSNIPLDAEKQFSYVPLDAQQGFSNVPLDAEKEFDYVPLDTKKEFPNS